jgi:hypothetical protein
MLCCPLIPKKTLPQTNPGKKKKTTKAITKVTQSKKTQKNTSG